MKRADAAIIAIILLSFIIGIYFYPQLPDRIISHWNAQGQPDGYMDKFWGIFLMPFVTVGIYLLFAVIPKIDPLKANIQKFRKYYNGFMVLIIGMMLYIFILTILFNLGFRFNFTQFITPALGLVFYGAGIVIEHAKMNWFVGIRTPWTLSSEQVWNKTHRLGGKLFKIAGLVALIGILFASYAVYFVVVPILVVAVYTVIYSYAEYQKIEKPGKKSRPRGKR
jgi:uncharacterized membrane protein